MLISPLPLEPIGLIGDGRKPDGLTLSPWYRGLSLAWDATAEDTFAQCHYKNSIIFQVDTVATEVEAAKS